MTRRILFSTIGATPQVVTETIWALMNRRNPPWRPDEIHIVTTTYALERIRKALQSPSGRLAFMFEPGTAPPVFIHLPCADGKRFTIEPPDARGTRVSNEGAVQPPDDALGDVNSENDAAVMGDLILQLVAGFTNDAGTEVHLSLAGGRKMMSAYAFLAMTLVGRPRDQASHVLVSPAHFEDHPEFWHPGQGGRIHHKQELHQQPLPEPTLDPEEAIVTLVPAPTPLIRYAVKDPKAISGMRLGKVVEEINLAAKLDTEARVVLDTSRNAVIACGVERILSTKQFAIYRLLATARKENWPGVGPGGESDDHAGWLTIPHICIGKAADGKKIESVLLSYMSDAVAASGGDTQDQLTLNEWRDGVVGDPKISTKIKSANTWFQSDVTRLPKALKGKFGAPAAAALVKIVMLRRKKGESATHTRVTRFGLPLPTNAIEIV